MVRSSSVSWEEPVAVTLTDRTETITFLCLKVFRFPVRELRQ